MRGYLFEEMVRTTTHVWALWVEGDVRPALIKSRLAPAACDFYVDPHDAVMNGILDNTIIHLGRRRNCKREKSLTDCNDLLQLSRSCSIFTFVQVGIYTV